MRFQLKCCGKEAPLGVDRRKVRLSFSMEDGPGITGYAITVWEKVSGETVCTLEGTPLDPMTRWVDPSVLRDRTGYCWQVIAQTPEGERIASRQGYFETGICVWQGTWITGVAQEGRVLEFERVFRLDAPVKKARLYICGLGYFIPQLNGSAVEDAFFIPPVTDYVPRPHVDHTHAGQGHRITYYTYDVTGLLRQGENCLRAEVAGGYFSNQEKVDYEPQPNFSFGPPCLIYELHMEDSRGNVRRIVSDAHTSVRGTNTVSQLYSGEAVDFTQPPEPWRPAGTVPMAPTVMTSPDCADDRVQRRLSPVKSWQTPEGTVFDFGVNHTGGLAMTVRSSEERELTIRFAEVLRSDGSLNYETAAWHGKHLYSGQKKHIYQQSTYRLKQGIQQIAPKFSWCCYRYALIPRDPAIHIEALSSLFIHMDLEPDGEFHCSEALLERINGVFLQTLRCNLHSGLLTDCPHREKLPYTGDGKLVMKPVCYNLDAVDFYYKWFRDILDAQTDQGLIPNSAPYFGGGGGYAWGNAVCTVSKLLYCYTGDLQVARAGYAAIQKWIGYCKSKSDENHIIRSNSHTWMLGDWLAPDVVCSNVYYISTVCYLQAVKTALFFAQIIDPDNCGKWQQLCRDITDGINRVFFDEQRCSYGNGVQGENMLALAEGIVPEAYQSRMRDALYLHYAEETDGHLDTGIVLTPVLLDYLTGHGYRDLAWRLMTAKTYPSYYHLMEGDTTLSEHWSKKWPDFYCGAPGNSRLVRGGGDLSHCHPMYGSVAAWLYESVAGLDMSSLYQRIIHVRPCFMDRLSWARAAKKTAFGQVRVEWSNEADRVCLKLDIPQGLRAVCHFPAVCKSLWNTQSGECHCPTPDGFFDFTLTSGQWLLTDSHTDGKP